MKGMTAALELGVFVFSVSLWAVLFWGSIRLLDPGNANNSFAKALAIGVLYGVAGWFVGHMALIGLFFGVAWLVFILRLLTSWYEMGFLKSLAVTAIINIGPYLLVPKMLDAVGGNVYVLLWGFPAIVMIVWMMTSRGVSLPALPRARAKVKTAPAAPAEPPVAMPVYRPVAPPAPPPPPGDKPRLLS